MALTLKIDSSIRAKYYGGQRGTPKYLIYHYTANGTTASGKNATAKGNANYFKNSPRAASAHYCVDNDKTVYNCVPDTNVGYSVGDKGTGKMKGKITNTNSISIEMVSRSTTPNPVVGKGHYYIPEETQANAIELGVYLMKKYNIPLENVYRHYDVTAKRCPEPMCYTAAGEANWKAFKKKLADAYNGKTSATPIKEVDDEVVEDRKIILLGKEVTVKGIMKEGSNYLAVRPIGEGLGLSVTSSGSTPIIDVGEVNVRVNGKDMKIKGFKGNGTNYCSIRQIAEALGKKVDWKDGKVVIE